ncbi:hypothetical protein KFL_002950150 [Klebsormidium nitens]|uniref:Uncharacterized protein n=1 Tax=Klebsormidium nitens TaxID=105231 RepID=A0A1Y1I7N3_KLENI|nr:hypothetical protein KFL_002950150 [Klebsormidium nitens]|eukprot:GAQ86543.1 hypothetical protein KFL_002950150 [Klebsormidium nitens]
MKLETLLEAPGFERWLLSQELISPRAKLYALETVGQSRNDYDYERESWAEDDLSAYQFCFLYANLLKQAATAASSAELQAKALQLLFDHHANRKARDCTGDAYAQPLSELLKLAKLDAPLKARIVACKTLGALAEESQEGVVYAGDASNFILSLGREDWASQPFEELERAGKAVFIKMADGHLTGRFGEEMDEAGLALAHKKSAAWAAAVGKARMRELATRMGDRMLAEYCADEFMCYVKKHVDWGKDDAEEEFGETYAKLLKQWVALDYRSPEKEAARWEAASDEYRKDITDRKEKKAAEAKAAEAKAAAEAGS